MFLITSVISNISYIRDKYSERMHGKPLSGITPRINDIFNS